jgi:hypothetical protein
MLRTNDLLRAFLALNLLLLWAVPTPAETLQGQVSRSTGLDSDSRDVHPGKAAQEQLNSEGANTEDEQRRLFHLRLPRLSGEANHGELPVGVLGCEILTTLFNSHNGVIVRIYPGSDLTRFGIHVGDRIIGYQGHRFIRNQFSEDCRGTPGTTIDLLIMHDGQEMEIQAVRKDARLFARYENYYRKCAEQTKYW